MVLREVLRPSCQESRQGRLRILCARVRGRGLHVVGEVGQCREDAGSTLYRGVQRDVGEGESERSAVDGLGIQSQIGEVDERLLRTVQCRAALRDECVEVCGYGGIRLRLRAGVAGRVREQPGVRGVDVHDRVIHHEADSACRAEHCDFHESPGLWF